MKLHRDNTDPLAGTSVTVTGTGSFIHRVASLLKREGASVFGIETISIKETTAGIPDDPGAFDWLVFTSSNGIRVFFDEMKRRAYDLRRLGTVKIACIGTGTAETLSGYGFYADFIPEKYTAKDLGSGLSNAVGPEEKLLILRAENGSKELNEELDKAGIQYTDEKIYGSVPALDNSGEAETAVDTDYIVFGSAAGTKAFFESRSLAPDTKVICIGKITEAEALKHTKVYKTATKHSADGILEILKEEKE
jgi:uroporphyrinogen III methyltransferase/synthase